MVHDEASEAAAALYKALAGGDRDALGALLHVDFRGSTTEGLPIDLGGTYDGPEAMRRLFWGQIARHYRVEAHPEQFHVLDDGRLYVSGRYRGEAIASGRPLDAAFVHILSFADGRISTLEQLTDSALWAESLGENKPFAVIEYSVVDEVAIVCFNRPEQRNAIDQRMADESLAIALRIQNDPSVRAVLIEGNGSDFNVGGDLGFMLKTPPDGLARLSTDMTTPFHEAFRILSRIDAPIVTATQGFTAGGGLGYLYAADIVIAAEGARFITAFAGIGLSGDGGGTWHLPRLVGPARAARMYLENTPITAKDALDWGLISEIVPADQLHDHAFALAKKLAAGPTKGFGHMRRLLNQTWTNTLSEQLLLETQNIADACNTEDAQNAIESFLAKKRPTFEGR